MLVMPLTTNPMMPTKLCADGPSAVGEAAGMDNSSWQCHWWWDHLGLWLGGVHQCPRCRHQCHSHSSSCCCHCCCRQVNDRCLTGCLTTTSHNKTAALLYSHQGQIDKKDRNELCSSRREMVLLPQTRKVSRIILVCGGGVGMFFTSLEKIEGSNPQGKSLHKILYQAYDVQVFLRIVNLLAFQKWHTCVSLLPKEKN